MTQENDSITDLSTVFGKSSTSRHQGTTWPNNGIGHRVRTRSGRMRTGSRLTGWGIAAGRGTDRVADKADSLQCTVSLVVDGCSTWRGSV